MAVEFTRKVWQERRSDYPNRRRLEPVSGEEIVFDVFREEGTVPQEGDQWSPATMEELEDRIAKAVTDLDIYTTETKTALDNVKANKASPALTGTPTAPTAAAGTNTPQIATTAFVTTATSNARPVSRTVTVTNSGWATVVDNGETVYRKSTAVTGSIAALPVLGIPPGQINRLTSSPSLVNDNGTIYIYSGQVPNINLTVTVTMIETR